MQKLWEISGKMFVRKLWEIKTVDNPWEKSQRSVGKSVGKYLPTRVLHTE